MPVSIGAGAARVSIAGLLANPAAASAAVALVCLVGSLAVLNGLALAVGASPAAVLGALVVGALGSPQAVASTVREAAPIALCGLAFLVPFRAGFFNIGAQGQLELGALAAVVVVTTPALPPPLALAVALVVAAMVGALTVLPALALKVTRGASEVTTTIMLYFAAHQLVLAMVSGPLKDPAAFYSTTPVVPDAARLAAVPPGSGIHLGVWVALAVTVLAAFTLRRTTFGFHLSAVGGNRAAAQVAGIRVDLVLAFAVLASAGAAGLAGGIQALGVVYRVAEGWASPWGFTGILAALLGGSPLGVLAAALLLAALETGARHMQAVTGVPAAMVHILETLPVILFLALRATPLVRRIRQAPAALPAASLLPERPPTMTSR